MALHLVVPGLLWPQDSLREVARDLPLPALCALLGRGERRLSPPGGLLDSLSRAFALVGDEMPWGSLRHRGEAATGNGGHRICADPVHIRLARDAMVVTDAGELDIGMAEAEDLVASLNAHFGDVGHFEAATPERWYLRVEHLPAIRTHALGHVIGRNFPLFLPEGPDRLRWRALLNEIQMLLHAHPRNTEREAAGRPVINSLWFWGAGTLPAASETLRLDAVFGDDAATCGLAVWAGKPVQPLPADAGAVLNRGDADNVLAVIGGLEMAALRGDAGAWREALACLERDWLAPLLEAIYAGRLGELRLEAPGDHGSLDLILTPGDRWKLWRRPMALWDLDFGPRRAAES